MKNATSFLYNPMPVKIENRWGLYVGCGLLGLAVLQVRMPVDMKLHIDIELFYMFRKKSVAPAPDRFQC
jgi:hypothetical protein